MTFIIFVFFVTTLSACRFVNIPIYGYEKRSVNQEVLKKDKLVIDHRILVMVIDF